MASNARPETAEMPMMRMTSRFGWSLDSLRSRNTTTETVRAMASPMAMSNKPSCRKSSSGVLVVVTPESNDDSIRPVHSD
jgi:hypothetical protein